MRAVVKTKNLIDANINVNCYFAPLPHPHPESQRDSVTQPKVGA